MSWDSPATGCDRNICLPMFVNKKKRKQELIGKKLTGKEVSHLLVWRNYYYKSNLNNAPYWERRVSIQPKDETNSPKTQVLTEAFDNYFLVLKGVGQGLFLRGKML